MKRFLSVFALSLVINESVFSQCTVTASALPDIIICGDCAELSAFGRGQGQLVFQENFNTGAPTGWAFTQQARFDNPCSPSGVDGTTHIWMGNTSAVPRSLQTLPYNFSTATSGVTICFDMLFSTQADAAPCEGPDEPDEGVYLQYKIGNGPWITINYFDPLGGYDPQFVNWNNWCFQLPQAAVTSGVSIQWFQDNDSGADYDHWGIDNVVIYFNDPTYEIVWLHDNYSYGIGNSGGVNPNPVCPRSDNDYVVRMSNGTTTCFDTVRIAVNSPVVIVDAVSDTTICVGECAVLHGTAKVVRKPAKTPTYFNGEVTPITSILGSTSNININITDLNMSTVLPGSITQVCITALTYFGIGFPNPTTIGDLNIYLVCPDGTKIKLIPSGQTTSTTPLQGYTNTCFTPSATANIGNASEPYTGTFASNEPLNNLVGCPANGVWSIEVTPASFLGFGVGSFFGWTITFDDPEISYPAAFTWSPTTNMTNSNTLTPTVCPPSNQTYTLTAQDTAGCVSASDPVIVNVTQNCCDLSFTGTAVNSTSCPSPNGSISIIVNSGSGNYQFTWNGNVTTQNRSGLAAGTYSVTVIDVTQNCQRDSTFTITEPVSPQITGVTVTHETCAGDNDGTATVNVTGGTGTLMYVWSTLQTGPSVNNLPPGSHSVTVTDANGCMDVELFIINPGPNCCTLQVTPATVQPNCGQSDGEITLTIIGSGNYFFQWSNSEITKDISNLSAGTYTVTVHDIDQNCGDTITVNLSNSSANAPVIDSITSTTEICRGDDSGTATVFTSGGSGALTIIWSTNETTATISGLVPGNYSVTVSDALGCQTIGSVTIAVGSICCNLLSSAVVIDADCNGAGGSITINVDPASGTPQFAYSIDSINFVLTNTFSGLAPGTYYATTRDANLCRDIDTVIINPASNSIVIITQATPITCFGDNNGIAQVDTSGGTPPLSILWSNNSTSKTIINLAAGDYYVTVTDQSNCLRSDTVTITEPAEVIVDLGGPVDFCDGGSSTLNAGSFSQYTWSTGDSISSIIATQTGDFTVTVYDANGCSAESTVSVTENPIPTVDAGLDSTIFDFESISLSPTVSGIINPTGFEWTPDVALSCNNCQNPIASPDSTLRYYLTYTDFNQCRDTSSVLIAVKDGDFYAVVPNAFSPNGDGFNEILFVYHEGLDNLVLRIYNRWGAMIFETRNPDAGWDGTFKGKLLDPDVFIYTLYAEFFNFTSDRTKGSVTLLR